jgi:hypothetical protein
VADTGREIAGLAKPGQVLEPWNDTEEHVERASAAVQRFLQARTPQETV